MVGSRGVYRAEDDPEYLDLVRLVSEEGIGGVIWFLSTPLETADLNHRLAAKAKVPLLVAADLEAGPGMRFPDLVFGPSAMAVAATGDLDLADAARPRDGRGGPRPRHPRRLRPGRRREQQPRQPRHQREELRRGAGRRRPLRRGDREGAPGRRRPGDAQALPRARRHRHRLAPLPPGPRLRPRAARRRRARPVPGRPRGGSPERHDRAPRRPGARRDAGPRPCRTRRGRTTSPRTSPRSSRKGTLPATLSHGITTKLLREEMRFDGLVFTDAMTMGGVVAHFETGEAAVRVLEAGGDVVLMPPDAKVAIEAIVGAVKSGRLPEARLDQAVARVLAEKERLGLFRETEPPAPGDRPPGRNARPEGDRGGGRPARPDARPRGATGPSRFRSESKLLALAIHDDRASVAIDTTLQAELKKRAAAVDYVRLDPTSCAGEGSRRRREGGRGRRRPRRPLRPAPLRTRDDRDPGGREGGDRRSPRLRQAGRRRLVREPLPPARRARRSPPTSAATARRPSSSRRPSGALYGEAAIEGRLPVTIPGIAPRGTGLRKEAVK